MFRALFVAVAVLCAAGAALAEKRTAFVVGNSRYLHAAGLANPANDAALVAETLEGLGFEVTLATDLTRAGMAARLAEFLAGNEGADLTVFYYAGHGMQFEGQNYLLGTDAALRSQFDVQGEALALDQVVAQLEAKSRAALVFVDACRDNPLADAFYTQNYSPTRALAARGLAPVTRRYQGAMLMFAASPGEVAYDGAGGNSPFTEALARHLPTENVEVLTLMKRVIRDVKADTEDRQTPMVTNDLALEVYLNLGEGGEGAAIAAAQEEAIFEAALAINTERAWDVYLRRFPGGAMREMALAAREELVAEVLAGAPGSRVAESGRVTVSREAAASAERSLGLGRDDARAVQAALNARGYDAGPEDGVIGTRTRRAIADFQQAAGLPSTGVVTQGTAEALGLALDEPEESDRVIHASRNARRYDPAQLALIEDDQRLLKAARALDGKEFVYGFYEGRLYLGVLNWTWEPYEVAEKIAEAAGGHLATLTSPAENDFAFELVRHDQRFWKGHSTRSDTTRFGPTFGLYQLDGSREPDGGWRWITGEPLDYANWLPGSPINANGNSSYGAFIWDIWGQNTRPDGKTFAAPTWHDFSHATPSLLIEIE